VHHHVAEAHLRRRRLEAVLLGRHILRGFDEILSAALLLRPQRVGDGIACVLRGTHQGHAAQREDQSTHERFHER